MKKLFIFSLMFLFMTIITYEVKADDYTTYQDIEFVNAGAKLLEDYRAADYEKYYGKMKKKRFWGWRTFIVYKNEELNYTSETLYVIINEGDTAIEETIKLTKEKTVKRQYSVTGSLGLSSGGTYKGFKLGLDQEIGTKATTTVTSNVEEVYTMKMDIDPGTKMMIKICGEGKITNGVGKYYRFYKNVKKGGWEIFVITTEYYSIEKVRL